MDLEKIKGVERKTIISGGERNPDLGNGSADPHQYHVVLQTSEIAH